MRSNHSIQTALGKLLSWLFWRGLLVIAMLACAIIAIYQFTTAGTLALEAQYGAVQAKLLIGALYFGFGLAACAGLWAMRKPLAGMLTAPTLKSKRELKAVMLVEAILLGYAAARKISRAP